jgi:hypothetical protein
MRTEQPIAGSVVYNAPPSPPNPPANVVQQSHQAATIQHVAEPCQPAIEEEAFPPPRGFVPMIQRGRPTRVQRKRGREVFHTEHAPPASPEYLNWSEHPIGFDRSNHPPKIPCPGHHALVLEA